MTLDDGELWSMVHGAETNALELNWSSTTSAMGAHDFKVALENLARQIEVRARRADRRCSRGCLAVR